MIKIRFDKTQMLLDDIKNDKKFIERWKNQLKKAKNTEKRQALKHEIKFIKAHMNRRKKVLEESNA